MEKVISEEELILEKKLKEYNKWSVMAEPELIESSKGQKFIKLETLDRLGFLKGYSRRESVLLTAPSQDTPAVVLCRITWEDGSVTEGLADASSQNCEVGFEKYLVAVAESRAYARALRKGLHINTCSKEEYTPEEGGFYSSQNTKSGSERITDIQVASIKHLLEKGKLSWSDSPFGSSGKELQNLTAEEGTETMKWIMSIRKKKGE